MFTFSRARTDRLSEKKKMESLIRPDKLSCAQMMALDIVARAVDDETFARIAKETAIIEPERLTFLSLSELLEKPTWARSAFELDALFDNLPELEQTPELLFWTRQKGLTRTRWRDTLPLYDSGRSRLKSRRSENNFLVLSTIDAFFFRVLYCVLRFAECMFSSTSCIGQTSFLHTFPAWCVRKLCTTTRSRCTDLTRTRQASTN